MNKKNITIASTNQSLYTTRRLIEEAKKAKYKVNWINPYQSTLPLNTPLTDYYFHRSTGTNYDDFDLLLAGAFADQGAKIMNPLMALRELRSKDQQWLFMRRHRLPHISSFVLRGPLTEAGEAEIDKWKCSEKYILKMTRGNQGVGVNLINGRQSLSSLLETFLALKDQRFILQPHIEHNKEWRVFISDDKIIAVIEKTITKQDFRGNAGRSRTKALKKIPVALSELALKSTGLAGVDYAGVDILEDRNGKLMILEINPIPGFESAEELTGINIAGELIQLCRD